jgi:23S rRNA (adenine2503-C2)-methyltransferase
VTGPADARPALAGLPREALRELLRSWGEPPYRADQAFRALWREDVSDPAAMSALPRAVRDRLATETRVRATEVQEALASQDGTTKWLLRLADGRAVETVLIPEGERRTVCVSTQVGCPIACVFCASGVGGLVRNLEAAEIAEQVPHAARAAGGRPTNVVVMGMGEPLLNLPALSTAIRIWEDPEGLGLSPRRVTVSTAATGALVDRLREADLGVNLAISLHAPDDETRRRLVPTSPEGRVEELVDAGARFARHTKRDVTVEYVLIADENDAPEQGDVLAARLRGRHLHVNLIPLNAVAHRPELRAPSGARARAFLDRLRAAGVSATLRTRRGDDIAAACGQLALERALGSAGPAPRRRADG